MKAPAAAGGKVVPWTAERVSAVVNAHPDRYRALPVVAAGVGLREGEVFGLALEDVDFLRRKVHVREQVKLLNGKPVFAPPKGGKTREVPLPDVVAVALSEHLRRYSAQDVTLPWRTLTREARTAALLFTSRESGALNRTYYNPHVWKPALETAHVDPTRANRMHALRHYYASVLLDAGESIRALADYRGHADPGFTLRIYAHMMPTGPERARAVVDAAHGAQTERSRNDQTTGG